MHKHKSWTVCSGQGRWLFLLLCCVFSPASSFLLPRGLPLPSSNLRRNHRAITVSMAADRPTFELLNTKYWGGSAELLKRPLLAQSDIPSTESLSSDLPECTSLPASFLAEISDRIAKGNVLAAPEGFPVPPNFTSVKPGARQAAVAVVLRLAKLPESNVDVDDVNSALKRQILAKSDTTERNMEAVEKALMDERSGLAAEILFISRTVFRPKAAPSSAKSVRDAQRWSGQVALPGGKQNEGESELETAQRECLEETGLDLTSDDFVLVGELPKRMATSSLALSALVFLQVGGAEKHKLKLDPEEVAAAWWVPLHLLARRAAVRSLSVDVRSASALPKWLISFLLALGVDRCFFPCLQLPEPPADQITMPLQPGQTVLWGLTFGVICDVLRFGRVERYGGQIPGTAGRWREVRLGSADGRVCWWASYLSTLVSGAMRFLLASGKRWTRLQLLVLGAVVGAVPVARRLLKR